MSTEINNTKIYTILKERDSEFLGAIDAIIPIVTQRLEAQIPKLFPEYTLHNIQHSIRVIEYISDIVSEINSFNDFELALMFLSALLHDIGMALGESEIDSIRNNQFFSDENIKYDSFVRLYGDKAEQEIVRRYHADISGKLISESKYRNYFILSDPHGVAYLEDIQLLCESHTKDYIWLSNSLSTHNVKGKYDYNIRFISHLIRIADLLDIDQSRTPYELYRLINPKDISDKEWRQHFIITNTKKLELNKISGNKDIVFYGNSDEIKIHRKLMSYINLINVELKVFIEFYEQLDDDKFKCNLSNQVVTNIQTDGFTVSDNILSLDFKSITELLMGENIYGDRKLGLREIIQNSIDACLVRKEIEKNNSGYAPSIMIEINKEKNTFTISDNGIGMSEDIIKNFFLNIGKSFYNSDIFKLSDYEYKPIGSFGIGFLACFMLSEDVTMETRYYNLPIKHIIQLEKGDEYIGFNSLGDVNFHGTKIELRLNQVLKVFDGEVVNIISFINTFFVNDDYGLKIINGQDAVEICNTISDSNKPGKNEILDDISKYIIDAKGYIKIKNKHEFIREVTDLQIYRENIFYIPDGKTIEDNVNFKDIVDTLNNKLVYVHLPLYDENQKEEFSNALEILDGDIDAAISKIDRIDDAYIFIPYENQEELLEEEVSDGIDPIIHGDVYLDDIINKIDDSYFCPKIETIKVNLLEDDSFSILVGYKTFNRYSFLWSNENHKLYLRNILIKNYTYAKQAMANTVNLLGYSLNLYKNDILPDISRNDLLPDSKAIVDNSINIAIHLSALENFNLKHDEKNILTKFIKTKLIVNSHFIRQEILDKYGL